MTSTFWNVAVLPIPLLDVPDGDPGPGRGETPGRGLADAGRAAGDDDDLCLCILERPPQAELDLAARQGRPRPAEVRDWPGTAGPGSPASGPERNSAPSIELTS